MMLSRFSRGPLKGVFVARRKHGGGWCGEWRAVEQRGTRDGGP
jgi:hypothetical protein